MSGHFRKQFGKSSLPDPRSQSIGFKQSYHSLLPYFTTVFYFHFNSKFDIRPSVNYLRIRVNQAAIAIVFQPFEVKVEICVYLRIARFNSSIEGRVAFYCLFGFIIKVCLFNHIYISVTNRFDFVGIVIAQKWKARFIIGVTIELSVGVDSNFK